MREGAIRVLMGMRVWVSVGTVGAAGLFVGASSDSNKLHVKGLQAEMLQEGI